MSRTLVVTAMLAAALGSATTVWLTTKGEEARAEPSLALHMGAGPREAEPRRARSRPRIDLRPRIEEEEARELPGLSGRADVEAYLDRLVARARAQGHVTAVEVEPGMSAIFGLRGTLAEGEVLAMADDFDARMQALSTELGASPAAPPPALDEALAQIAGADDPLARQDAIDDALEALEGLDEPERLAAEARLDEVLRDETPSARADPVALREAIDMAVGTAERERAVRRYVEAVENLPREEAEARLAEVERDELPGVSLL